MMRKYLVLFFALAAAIQGRGQDVAVVPSDPQVASLPERIVYVKTFSHMAPTGAAPMDSVEITKDGELRRELRHYSGGRSEEFWRSGEFGFVTDAAQPGHIFVTNATMLKPNEKDELGDFGELGWINQSTFQGEETRYGVKCYVYRSGDKAAWIEEKSRYPLFFQSARGQITYSYKAAPSERLVLPERFAKKLDSVKKAWFGRSH